LVTVDHYENIDFHTLPLRQGSRGINNRRESEVTTVTFELVVSAMCSSSSVVRISGMELTSFILWPNFPESISSWELVMIIGGTMCNRLSEATPALISTSFPLLGLERVESHLSWRISGTGIVRDYYQVCRGLRHRVALPSRM
jgi:hypothetical protein